MADLRPESWCRKWAEPAILAAENSEPGFRSEEELARLTAFLLGGLSKGGEAQASHGAWFRNFFAHNFSAEVLLDVCQDLELRVPEPGTSVFKAGEHADKLFVVCAGRVHVLPRKDRPLLIQDVVDIEGTIPRRPAARRKNPEKIRTEQKNSPVDTSEKRAPAGSRSSVADISASGAEAGRKSKRISVQRDKPPLTKPMKPAVPSAKFSAVVYLSPKKSAAPDPGDVLRESSPGTIAKKEKAAQTALQRDDRVHRPVVELVNALATVPQVAPKLPSKKQEPEAPSFLRQWGRFNLRLEGGEETPPEPSTPVVAPPPAPAQAVPQPTVPAPETLAAPLSAPTSSSAAHVPVPSSAPVDASAELSTAPLPGAVEMGPGAVLGAESCLAGKKYLTTAVVAPATVSSTCKLLVLNFKVLHAVIEQETSRRALEREAVLRRSLAALEAVGAEKLNQLARACRTVHHRRGATLCCEGELKSHYGRLDILMAGHGRIVKSVDGQGVSVASMASAGIAFGSVRDVGMLLAGHLVNSTSQLLDLPEPFTVLADSAVASVLTVARGELGEIVGPDVMEELSAVALRKSQWHEKQLEQLRVEAEENDDLKRAGQSGLGKSGSVSSLMRNGSTSSLWKSGSVAELRKSDSTAELKSESKELEEGSKLSPKLSETSEYLHDEPVAYHNKPQAPPGILDNKTMGMMTDTLIMHDKPNPLDMPCPKMHPSQIQSPRGQALYHAHEDFAATLNANGSRTSLAESSSDFWDSSAAKALDGVMHDMDEWALTSLSPFAKRLQEREHLNETIRASHFETLALRGEYPQVLHVNSINPIFINSMEVGGRRVKRELRPPTGLLPSTVTPLPSLAATPRDTFMDASWHVLDELFEPEPAPPAPTSPRKNPTDLRRGRRLVVSPRAPGIEPAQPQVRSAVMPELSPRRPKLKGREQTLKPLEPVEDAAALGFAALGPLHVHSIDRFLDKTRR
mmetsp:Transcript_73733/g.130180  ORF Transcript_73733/g.130180 Transcript_73733/m.130180 type:complete len:969 (+) Transcript_73733:31-2937(+)